MDISILTKQLSGDPVAVLNDILERLERLEQGEVIANSNDEITNNVGAQNVDELFADMIRTNADTVDINWWLPLNLASDSVALVRALAYDGIEWVYVGGNFTRIGNINANNIARYSLITRNWDALGSGADADVFTIAIDGSNIYMGGAFGSAGGVANTVRIAKWNGSAWSALGTGATGSNVNKIIVNGSDVYACGAFTLMGGVANTVRIAKWNGSAWSALGTGAADQVVFTITFDGNGNLIAGGSFSGMGGVANTANIAKWTGSAWNSVGIFNSSVQAIYYDSVSTYIYAGGAFTTITGFTDVVRIAKYDGTIWSALGTGIANGIVFEISVDTDNNIIAGGSFTDAGEDPLADRIAIFKNGAWQAISNAGGLDGDVNALLVLDNSSIIVGGSFNYAGSIKCQSIAVYCKPLSEAIDIIASLFELYSASEGHAYLTKFGDGSDGDVTISTTVTLARDMYYKNLTIASGGILKTNGFTVYVRDTLNNQLGGLIDCSGSDGGNGATGTGAGGAGGAAPYTATRPLLPNPTAGAVGEGTSGTGTANGTTKTAPTPLINTSLEPYLWMAGAGGAGGAAHGVSDGSNNIPTATIAGAKGGNGGAATGAGTSSRRGGGGGGGGGVIFLFAYKLTNDGTIDAKGGAGGNGVTSTDASGNGGGGGGGAIIIYYHTGNLGTRTVTGGAAGTGGNGGTAGVNGKTASYVI